MDTGGGRARCTSLLVGEKHSFATLALCHSLEAVCKLRETCAHMRSRTLPTRAPQQIGGTASPTVEAVGDNRAHIHAIAQELRRQLPRVPDAAPVDAADCQILRICV